MALNPEWYKSPSQLICELGIEEPGDIDIEAIAEECGATIRYRSLHGCAARIMGFNNRAIITIDNKSSRPRQRFSAGHELGHWMKDRGQVSFQCTEKKLVREWSQENPETRANRFASDILLPPKMFRRHCHKLPATFSSVEHLADAFNTSLTATAIRLVEYGDFPSMLVCSSRNKREWFVANGEVKGRLWPKDRPGTGSLVHQMMQFGMCSITDRDVGADEWINHPRSAQYWLHEDSLQIADDLVLSLLWWHDESQIIDFIEAEEIRDSRRSDWRAEE